jgi:CheY-like chemotaxis protein
VQDGKFVVLCVDDDPDVTENLTLILDGNGYVAVTANSAEDAVKAFTAAQPDLIIIDLMMEEVDSGTGLVKELRALGNAAPIYMLSSVGDMMHAQTADEQLGLSGVLQKPVAIQTLIKILEQKLGKAE